MKKIIKEKKQNKIDDMIINDQKEIEEVYKKRFEKHYDELRWLYMELYENDSMFAELCDQMYQFYM